MALEPETDVVAIKQLHARCVAGTTAVAARAAQDPNLLSPQGRLYLDVNRELLAHPLWNTVDDCPVVYAGYLRTLLLRVADRCDELLR